MPHTIVLIGPPRAGKSTIGRMLSFRLGVTHVSMDDVRFDYYLEIGYDEKLAAHIQESGGFWELYRYWKPFEAYAVERVLADHVGAVIDFGAGHSVYDDEVLFSRVEAALSTVPNVVLLVPSSHPERSLAILAERDPGFAKAYPDLSPYFVKHPANRRLAKFVVYTEGKTAAETCQDIVHVLEVAGTYAQ